MNKLWIPVIAVLVIVILAVFVLLGEPMEPSLNEIDVSQAMLNKEVTLEIDGYSINGFLDKPQGTEFDAFLLFHGITFTDEASVDGAKEMSTKVGKPLSDLGFLSISVAYSETELPPGGELGEAKTAVDWLKTKAADHGLKINKIYLLGHSRGGYIVTMLNTLVETDGVIANAPGTNLTRFYELYTSGALVSIPVVQDYAEALIPLMIRDYGGTPDEVPEEWNKRSVIPNIRNFKSKILFIQGTQDNVYQVELMEELRAAMEECGNECVEWKLITPDTGHWGFDSDEVGEAILDFVE